MKKEKHISQFEFYKSNDISDFNDLEQSLIQKTIAKAKDAYAPYSRFNVSAGLLLENESMLFGTNVENASYPVGICAERNVLANCMSNQSNENITTITVYAEKDIAKLKTPITPCGMCRQALLEAENRQSLAIKVIMIGND